MSMIHGYKCDRALQIFEDICKIPHGSGNESGVADYIQKHADALGLYNTRDSFGNVFIKKPASAGYENRPALLLQGHMDMVCEKDEGVIHDFEKDALDLFVENGLLGARGTSLGGDDGIAVAMMLALLETDAHPALECLFTVEEETGLAGAKGFDCSQITAKRMINLDSEEESTVTAGCAGGVRTEIVFERARVDLQRRRSAMRISISGLAGGHSGADINSGRQNAIVLMGRLLQRALSEQRIWLCEINGGGKDNAIARECSAVLICEDAEGLRECISSETDAIRKELCALDGGICVTVSDTNAISCYRLKDTRRIIALLSLSRTGVLKESCQIKGLVEYSRNLGVVITDGDRIVLTLSSRSSIEAQLDMSCRELDLLASSQGAEARHYARYPGWEYQSESGLREEYLNVCQRVLGKRPEVVVIHAGLECGIISSKTDGMDIISIGPDMYDIHSPAERLSLASCERIWKVLLTFVSER